MLEKFPKQILCPVDFSELSGAALRYAVKLSSASGAAVTAVHAYSFETPPYITPKLAGELERQYENTRKEAQSALTGFAERAGAANANLIFEEGDATTSILRTANDARADLIVMGTHGRRGVERFMLGSVAERVLRTSDIPVITVRGTALNQQTATILCPVNNSEASRKALRVAARLASTLKAQLTAIHVEDRDEGARIEDLCTWIEGEMPDCQIRDIRGRGDAAEEILKLVKAGAFDLLVIGATHRVFFDSTVLGTTTVRVVRHAACPVLTVPHSQ